MPEGGGDWSWLLMLVLAGAALAVLVWVAAHALVLAALVAPPVAVAVAGVAWMMVAAHGTPPWLKPAVVVRLVRTARAVVVSPLRSLPVRQPLGLPAPRRVIDGTVVRESERIGR